MRKFRAIAAVVLSLMLVLGACTVPDDGGAPANPPADGGASTAEGGETDNSEGSGPKVGGTLNVGLAGDPYSVASWVSNDMNASLITNIAFPRLMEIDAEGNKVPYLIKDYTINDDATQYTVELVEGLTWHDGTPLTAEDLAFTAAYTVEHAMSYGADMYSPVESTEVVNDTTIVYNLKSPSVNFLSQVGYWVQVMPKHIYEDVEDPYTFDHPVIGYGPYKYVEHRPGEYYTFERVENWPFANDGQGAYIQNIIFRVYPDANAMILALKNGEIDVTASSIPTVAQKQLDDDPGFDVLSVPSLGFGYFAISYGNPNLADSNMRKAIAMTVDRDALVNIAMQGGAIKMETPISPVYDYCVQANITYPAFDLDAANALLDEAGFLDVDGDGVREDKDGNPMSFTLTHRSNTANADSIANIFKDNCAQVGLSFEVQSLDPATYTDKVTKGYDFDVNFIDWGVIDDPDSSLATIYKSDSALNFMQYKNDRIDELLTMASAEPDLAKRIEIMDEFQELFVEEIPSINAWVRINSFGVSTRFEGWNVLPGLHGIMNTREIVEVYEK